MNRLTKIIKGKCGHDQIYYVPKYGNPITPIDMTDWDDTTLANHLYDILNSLKRYEDTGLEPEKLREILELFCWSQNFNGDFKLFITALKQLKEMVEKYEKLEERGLLIKLPCKVRDIVYVDAMTFGTRDDIEYAEAEVVSIRITKKQTFLKLRIFALGLDGMPYGCKNYSVSSFGKTVFLTEREIKKALEDK